MLSSPLLPASGSSCPYTSSLSSPLSLSVLSLRDGIVVSGIPSHTLLPASLCSVFTPSHTLLPAFLCSVLAPSYTTQPLSALSLRLHTPFSQPLPALSLRLHTLFSQPLSALSLHLHTPNCQPLSALPLHPVFTAGGMDLPPLTHPASIPLFVLTQLLPVSQSLSVLSCHLVLMTGGIDLQSHRPHASQSALSLKYTACLRYPVSLSSVLTPRVDFRWHRPTVSSTSCLSIGSVPTQPLSL